MRQSMPKAGVHMFWLRKKFGLNDFLVERFAPFSDDVDRDNFKNEKEERIHGSQQDEISR